MEYTIKSLNELITAITKGQAKTSRDIGKAIMVAVYLSIVEKDAGGATALVKCLRKSTKMQKVVDTLEAYGNLGYKNSDKTFGHFEVSGRTWPETKEGIEELRTKCMAWEDFAVEREVTALDVAEKVEAIITAVAKAQKGKREVLHAEMVAKLTEMVTAARNAEYA